MVVISLTGAWLLSPVAFGKFAVLVAALSAIAVVVKTHAVDMPIQVGREFTEMTQQFPRMWAVSAVFGSAIGAAVAHWSHISMSAGAVCGAGFATALARQECYRRILQYPQYASIGTQIREGRAWIVLVTGISTLQVLPRLTDLGTTVLLLATAALAANITWPAAAHWKNFGRIAQRGRIQDVPRLWRNELSLDGALSAALHQGTIVVVGMLDGPLIAGRVRLYQIMFMPLFVTLTVVQGQWFRRQNFRGLSTSGLIRLGVASYFGLVWAFLPFILQLSSEKMFLLERPSSGLPYVSYFALLAITSGPYLKMRNGDCLKGILCARIVQVGLILGVVPILMALANLADRTLGIVLALAALLGWAAWEVAAHGCAKNNG